jgi:hypothetical protein
MRGTIPLTGKVAIAAGAVLGGELWRLPPPAPPTPPAMTGGSSVTVRYSPPTRCWWSPEFEDAPSCELSEFARGELARVGLGPIGLQEREPAASVNAP